MELLYFIIGIIFVSYVIPVFDGISALFLTYLEAKKAKLNEIINQSNIQIRRSAEEDDTPQRRIGFCVEEEEDEEDYEDEV